MNADAPTPMDSRRRRLKRLQDLLMPLPMALAVWAYLAWVASPSAVESLAIVLGYALPAILGCLLILSGVDMRRAKAIPAQAHRTILASSLASLALVPLLLAWIGGEGWFAPSVLRSLALCAIVNAAANAQVCFYRARRRLDDVQRDVVSSSTEPILHGSKMTSRLRVAIVLPAIACMLVSLDFASHLARRQADAQRIDFAVASVDALAGAEGSMSERVANALPGTRFRPGEVSAFMIDSDTLDAAGTRPVSDAFMTAVDAALAAGETRGALSLRGGRGVGAFGTAADGRPYAVVVRTPETAPTPVPAALVVGVAGLIVFLFGTVVTRDLAHSIYRVRAHAERLAGGDLRGVAASVADDELGDLERGLVRIATSFRGALGEARSAADGVESTIAELSAAIGGIVEASNDQARQVEQAHALMTAIRVRVGEAQGSAGALDSAIEESSHSVVELGAAGDELNETASVLTSKVDAVSDSLEQMVRSVKEVGATTDRLAEASEETSSSMEEMASAMRAVDTAAETTANLSRDVVEKAELGQAKVVQTIAGMEAIREATDAAESVIKGLGARTNEIGGILDVIEDVADETNLLALNAAIIAAQAGEQGKAFSVVADEIKELADRVLASTKEIGGLIRAVQEESENAIGAIEAGSASVMGGVDLSAEAGRTLEEITVASRESGTRISEIVVSVREQTKAASHVVALMEKVRDSAEQIGAASNDQDRGNEIVYRSALTMREVAQQVRQTTEDQARGFGRIRENVNGVRDAVEQIAGSLGDQSAACEQVATALDGVATGARSNHDAARRVRDAMRMLAGQAEGLRGNVERFRC